MMPADKPEAAWDITKQLVEGERGRGINVVLGGGRGSFTPAPGPGHVTWNCSRRDGVDMVNTWRKIHPEGEFVQSKSELFKIKSDTENVLGMIMTTFPTLHLTFVFKDYSVGIICPMMTSFTLRMTPPRLST